MDGAENEPMAEDSPPVMAACEMCHRALPEHEIVFLGGRSLCFGCVSAWFDDDGEN